MSETEALFVHSVKMKIFDMYKLVWRKPTEAEEILLGAIEECFDFFWRKEREPGSLEFKYEAISMSDKDALKIIKDDIERLLQDWIERRTLQEKKGNHRFRRSDVEPMLQNTLVYITSWFDKQPKNGSEGDIDRLTQEFNTEITALEGTVKSIKILLDQLKTFRH